LQGESVDEESDYRNRPRRRWPDPCGCGYALRLESAKCQCPIALH
jgi:hypothetical protein